MKKNERAIFESFYRNKPDFAGRLIEWEEGTDPPDVICLDKEGKRLGVELAEWLNEEQMKASKLRERIEESFLKVIQSQNVVPPSKIGMIWLNTKPNTQLKESDAENFCNEIYAFIEKVNSDSSNNKDFDSPQGFSVQDFSGYSFLDRYLEDLHFFSRVYFAETSLGIPWIRFQESAGPYTPPDAVNALLKILDKKISKYQNLHQEQNLDELYLLIFYDQGLLHNTPFIAPGFGFQQIVEIANREANINPGFFQKIFLFNSIYPNQEVAELWVNKSMV